MFQMLSPTEPTTVVGEAEESEEEEEKMATDQTEEEKPGVARPALEEARARVAGLRLSSVTATVERTIGSTLQSLPSLELRQWGGPSTGARKPSLAGEEEVAHPSLLHKRWGVEEPGSELLSQAIREERRGQGQSACSLPGRLGLQVEETKSYKKVLNSANLRDLVPGSVPCGREPAGGGGGGRGGGAAPPPGHGADPPALRPPGGDGTAGCSSAHWVLPEHVKQGPLKTFVKNHK